MAGVKLLMFVGSLLEVEPEPLEATATVQHPTPVQLVKATVIVTLSVRAALHVSIMWGLRIAIDQLLRFVKGRLVELLEPTTTVQSTVPVQKVKVTVMVTLNARAALNVSMM